MDQHRVVLLNGIGRVRKIVRRHSLQHGGGGLARGDAVGNCNQASDRRNRELRVSPGNAAPGNAVANFDAANVRPNANDDARRLLAGDERQRRRVAALAQVDVDEVDAAGLDLDERFAGAGRGGGQLAELKHFGPAGLGDLDRSHNASMLPRARRCREAQESANRWFHAELFNWRRQARRGFDRNAPCARPLLSETMDSACNPTI